MKRIWFCKVYAQCAIRILVMLVFILKQADVSSSALEVPQSEQGAIQECEKKLCATILSKRREGEDLSCILSKTWDRNTIKKGERNAIQWGFGDARCSINLLIKRQEIVSALTANSFTTEVPRHKVRCIVELNGIENPIGATVAPKLIFKEGRLEKIWINLSGLEGQTAITSFIWITTQLEDKFGIFHKSMIRSVNKFIYQKCPKNYNFDGTQKLSKGSSNTH